MWELKTHLPAQIQQFYLCLSSQNIEGRLCYICNYNPWEDSNHFLCKSCSSEYGLLKRLKKFRMTIIMMGYCNIIVIVVDDLNDDLVVVIFCLLLLSICRGTEAVWIWRLFSLSLAIQ